MKIDRKGYDAGNGNWVSGELDGWGFSAKVFAGTSTYGIPTPRFPGGGNVSKLYVYNADGRNVWAFDRGPVCGYTDPRYAGIAAEIAAELEAEFCLAGTEQEEV